ncbi:hypothetical protein CRENBAI_008725 [Crenichthys baileyi]|uniref:Uncharacterized protein n=1 Tax=Crenichthys baileyi TaxID=28760 RepID=A0AAV9RMJ8_9TELE
MYGDTYSVIVTVGYGPGDSPESEVNESQRYTWHHPTQSKSERTWQNVHGALIKDTLNCIYVIGAGNRPEKLIRDPEGRRTKEGYPIYLARVPDTNRPCSVTEAFVSGRRLKLGQGPGSVQDKRSPCDSVLTETLVACVMRGDSIKMENSRVPCFTVCPWHKLAVGDVVLYVDRDLYMDDVGRWSDMDEAGEVLRAFKVDDVASVDLDAGLLAVSVRLKPTTDARSDRVDKAAAVVVVMRTLYKDGKYSMNHFFYGIRLLSMDLSLKVLQEQALCEANARASINTSYVEVLRMWLKENTVLSSKPIQCCEYYKCKPCKAAFHRYLLNLQAESGCIKAMFRGSLICKHVPGPDLALADPELELRHTRDKTLMNVLGKLLAHCIADYCLPGRMLSRPLQSGGFEDCRTHLRLYVASVRAQVKKASAAFNEIMNNCPEHMIPASEIEYLHAKREKVTCLSRDKLEACRKVIKQDMFLNPGHVYETLCALLRENLEQTMLEGTVSVSRRSQEALRLSIPCVIGENAGLCVAFDDVVRYLDSVPCIMPYSCANTALIQKWIASFKFKKWLEPMQAQLGKRKHSLSDPRDMSYHCIRCKNFYKDLFANNVSGDTLIQRVYYHAQIHRTGRCVSETRWLS